MEKSKYNFKFPVLNFMKGQPVKEMNITQFSTLKAAKNLLNKIQNLLHFFFDFRYLAHKPDEVCGTLFPDYFAKLAEFKTFISFSILVIENGAADRLNSFISKLEKNGCRSFSLNRLLWISYRIAFL